MHEGTWTIRPCPHRQSSTLARELGVSEITASVLVRRGYDDPDEARAFLAGEQPLHDPFLLGDMADAVERIRAAVAAGKRICVHGDYDVDGICATALAVLTLRAIGAEVEWHLPSRFEEGYGIAEATLERLADEGCGLVLTVDCGITAVEEVTPARARGLEVIVTDHHRPGETLPDCPLVVTRPSEYPFPELCGTGVVFKLAQALLGESEDLARHIDLVALATIADVVPLVGENRSLAIAGLRALARTTKPGLQALMNVARVDPAGVDAGAVGFRLGPRINAAGRLGHPAAALDLLLTEDGDTARRLAQKLEELNRERQGVEERILREATAQIEEWPEAQRRRRGYVLAHADWHEGVIGIVASRLAERFHRPVVLIAGTGEDEWKGSGRSIPAFDLHAALGACASHLGRFGGHRAAAGLSIRSDRVDDFAEAFAAEAARTLSEETLLPVTVVDAVLPPRTPLTLGLCEELQRLAPFGLGNPEVTLLAGDCELGDLAAVGEGKHLRFRVRQEGRDAGSAIAFRLGGQLDRLRRIGRYDVAFRLEENRWNGTVAPQLVVRRVFDAPEGYEELRDWLKAEYRKADGSRNPGAAAVFAELELGDGGGRRNLLESPTFRKLLEEGRAMPAAA
jgi:single-stranded-DNA-specific exonuclease